MASLNKAIIIGHLGADPELRYTQTGLPLTNLSVATNEQWVDKSGESQERTEWHRVVVFGKTAENCSKYLSKGRQVYVEGRLQTRDWEDRDGNKRYTTELVANNVLFLDGGGGQRNDSSYDQGLSGAPAGGSNQGGQFDQSFNDDDIPF